MNTIKCGLLVCLLSGSAVVRTFAGSPAPDKWQYNLFHPTPRDFMREMSTDRPDKTESAYTVDAGHFQIETTLVQFGLDNRNADGERGFGINAGNVNLKVGLTNNSDLQIVVDNYLYEQVQSDGSTTRKSGFGDIQTRLKINLWGNDGGITALAVMPYINWPTNTNGFGDKKVTGGIIVPLAVELPWGFGLGVMTEVDFVVREEGGYGANFVNSITLSHCIIGNLSGYTEVFTELQDTGRDPVVTLDAGLTYMVTENFMLDAGINFGLTEAADDFNPFVGLSMRF